MHDEFPVTPDTGVARVGRRDMLKSAGVLLAASTTGLGAEAWVTLGALGQQTHRVLTRHLASTDPAAHVKAINKLFDSGVSIVNIHSGQPDQRKVLDCYGKEVLPQLVG
jgi:hypothetical protein